METDIQIQVQWIKYAQLLFAIKASVNEKIGMSAHFPHKPLILIKIPAKIIESPKIPLVVYYKSLRDRLKTSLQLGTIHPNYLAHSYTAILLYCFWP